MQVALREEHIGGLELSLTALRGKALEMSHDLESRIEQVAAIASDAQRVLEARVAAGSEELANATGRAATLETALTAERMKSARAFEGLGGAFEHIDSVTARVLDLEVALAERTREANEAEAVVADAQQRFAELEAERDELARTQRAQDRRVSSLLEEALWRETMHTDLSRRLAEAERARAQSERAMLEADSEALLGEARLDELETVAAAAESRAANLEQTLATRTSRLASAQRSLEAAQAARERHASELETAKARIAEIQAAFAEVSELADDRGATRSTFALLLVTALVALAVALARLQMRAR